MSRSSLRAGGSGCTAAGSVVPDPDSRRWGQPTPDGRPRRNGGARDLARLGAARRVLPSASVKPAVIDLAARARLAFVILLLGPACGPTARSRGAGDGGDP